jgi:hypothetical protein
LNTSSAPLVELFDQLSKQSAAVHAVLQSQIEAISAIDPDDQEEFGTLREFFAENQKHIEHCLREQMAVVEALADIMECEPVA